MSICFNKELYQKKTKKTKKKSPSQSEHLGSLVDQGAIPVL